jgi:hypothetical protein
VRFLIAGRLPELGWRRRAWLSLCAQRLLVWRKLGRLSHDTLRWRLQLAWQSAAGHQREDLVTRFQTRMLREVRENLHATETNTPDRHDGLAQRCSGQRRLWPGSHRPGAILCHSREFGQHFVHEHVNIGKRIPQARRRLCRTDGGSHVLTSTLLITAIGLNGRLAGHRTQFN